MSQFYKKVDHYKNVMLHLGINCDQNLLTAITKGLGPSIYRADSEIVSSTSDKELQTVRTNFLRKKLGNFDSKRNKIAIEKMGKSNKHKYRAIFYYLLVKELSKEYIYEESLEHSHS